MPRLSERARLQVGGLAVTLRSDVRAPLAPLLALWSALPRAPRGRPDLRYDLLLGPRRKRLVVNGRSRFSTPRADLALAGLELAVYRDVAERTPATPLHAGAVTLNGRALLVAGPSGAGKTTLVRELVVRGASYMADEHVFLQPSLPGSGPPRVSGFPRALDAGPYGAGWRRGRLGLAHAADVTAEAPLTAAVVLALPRRPGAGPTPLAAAAAAVALTGLLHRDPRPADLANLCAATAAVPCVELASQGVEAAADALLALLDVPALAG